MKNGILKSSLMTILKEYSLVTLGVVSYALGWTIFLLPNNLIGGGVSGFASILYYATGLPMGVTYFVDPLVRHPERTLGIGIHRQAVFREDRQAVGSDHFRDAMVNLGVDVVSTFPSSHSIHAPL